MSRCKCMLLWDFTRSSTPLNVKVIIPPLCLLGTDYSALGPDLEKLSPMALMTADMDDKKFQHFCSFTSLLCVRCALL